MNAKAAIPLVAGLCIGGFALKMGFDTLRSAKGAPVATVQIMAAKDDIPRGSEITEEMLQTISYPAKSAPPGTMKEKKDVVGRVARVDAPAGLPILEKNLLAPGKRPGLYVKPGFRAVAVKIDESSGVDYHLQPGCRVDVVGFFNISRNGKQQTLARTLIENVEVAAVGSKLSAIGDSAEGGKKDTSKDKQARAVVLFVKPEDQTILHLAEQRGKLKLSMRNDEDSGIEETTGSVSDRTVIEGQTAEKTDESEPGDGTKEKAPTLADRIKGFFSKKAGAGPAAPAVAAVKVEIPAPPAIPIDAWRMIVCHGDNKEEIIFRNKNTRDRVGAEAGEHGKSQPPPVAPQPAVEPAAGSPGNSAPAGAAPQAPAKPEASPSGDKPAEPQEPAQNDSEPEELPE